MDPYIGSYSEGGIIYGRTIDREMAALLTEIQFEVDRSKVHGEKFASLHEAWGVLYEELDEVWEITRQKRRERDPHKLREELVQIAAMAIKAVRSMENLVGG